MRSTILFFFMFFGIFLIKKPLYAQEEPVKVSIDANVFKPAHLEPSEERMQGLKLPPGFTIEKFAENMGEPRMLAVSERGDVYVTERENSEVIMLQDTNRDGKADLKEVVAQLNKVHGINIRGSKMYLATVKEIYQAQISPEGRISEPQLVVSNLPDGGQHPNRTLAFGPDRKMYVSIGSSCNACEESNEEHATLLQMNTDGSDRKIFARGLRNTMGFGWHPETKELWGMDHGIDWLGDTVQKEELNKLEAGLNYGWPYIYGKGNPTPHREPPGEISHEEYAAKTMEPVLEHPEAHSAALGMLFYTADQFPAAYKNDAFIALHGSWNRAEPAGYKIVRLRFENGEPVAFEDFVTGFLLEDGRAQFGRPVALAIHQDGSLLFTDDEGGVVYRVTYQQQ